MEMNLRGFLLVALLAIVKTEPCTEYGCPGRPRYELFVPAPPGHTPRCAKPGQTYCEAPDHYPQQLIKFLVDKCSFDFSTALRDELGEDFNTYRSQPEYHTGYDYPRQDIPSLYLQLPFLPPPYPFNPQPALTYGVPSNDTHNGYKYSVPPSRTQRNPFLPEAISSVNYHQRIQHESERSIYTHTQSLNSFNQEQNWWPNRYSHNSKLAPRTFRENPLLQHAKLKRDRVKRQSNLDSIAICPTVGQDIAPRAALNNQGNWMYIVNVQEEQTRYTQRVRSEKCTTDTCNGICSLPAGYTSRCQQQYVQKRLIALEGSGNRLYTDIFWLPHGCSCQVMLNY